MPTLFTSCFLFCVVGSQRWLGAAQMCGILASLSQRGTNMGESCHCPPRLLTWDRPSPWAERLPPEMSSNHNFQCFDAVEGEGSHKSSLHKHHSSCLPRIPHHGMLAHHEPLEECYLCSEYRYAQALEALETQVLPLYHTSTPYQHHHPHQYVVRGPTRPEEAHSGHDHIHHHRYNKRVMLVKNSDPSLRKTIILHRRSLRSFDLFLEELSELMQYHIRKLYTLEGCKVSSTSYDYPSFIFMSHK